MIGINLMFLVACHSAATDGSEATSGSTTPGGPTYWADIRPILDWNCARCHTDGGQAPSFDDAETARALAPLMAAYTAEGRMPPAAPDPSCADYGGSDRFVVDDEEMALLAAWADAGAPLGDPAGYVAAAADAISTAPFDLELRGTTSYQPVFGDDGNDYRCFLLDVGNPAVTYLTGLEAVVDNDAIVHHIVLFELFDGGYTGDGTGDPHDGFACGGLGEGGWDFLAAWGPGANPVTFPDGSGMRLPKEAQLVLQMHYFESYDGAENELDQSGYGLHLADHVDRRVEQYLLGATGFTIPAGDAAYSVTEHIPWGGTTDMDVLGVWPHMHVLGSGFDERIVRADGSESCLLHQDRWDFHNQVWAPLVTPEPITAGDEIQITCTWDNSALNPNQPADPPQDVAFGEETGNEMCIGFTYLVDREK